MSNQSFSHDAITTATCDDCGQRKPGVMHHSHGAPVMFVCKDCGSKQFERAARADVDVWLNGGEFAGF